MRGQSFDGAISNMQGHKSGIQTRITNKEPRVRPVHCVAHRFNF